MALTKTQEHLILGLGLFDLTEEEQEAIFLFLQTEEQQTQMVDYLLGHQDATGQDILKEMSRILGTTAAPMSAHERISVGEKRKKV